MISKGEMCAFKLLILVFTNAVFHVTFSYSVGCGGGGGEKEEGHGVQILPLSAVFSSIFPLSPNSRLCLSSSRCLLLRRLKTQYLGVFFLYSFVFSLSMLKNLTFYNILAG